MYNYLVPVVGTFITFFCSDLSVLIFPTLLADPIESRHRVPLTRGQSVIKHLPPLSLNFNHKTKTITVLFQVKFEFVKQNLPRNEGKK